MYRTTYMLCSVSLLFGIIYGMYTPTVPIFATNELGANYRDLGVIGMATFLPYALVPLVIGILLDRINSKYLLTVGFAINAVSMYLISTSTTITELVLYSLLLGFSYSMTWPPAMHALSQNPATRVKLTAVFTMCFVVGYMVGPLIGSVILETPGAEHRTLFLILAYLSGAGLVSILLKYPHHKSKGVHIDIHLFKEVLKFPVLVTVLLYSTVTFGLVLSIYPAFLQERGFESASIMYLYAIFGVTRILAFLLAKKLAEHRRGVLLFSTLCVIAAMALSMVGSTFAEFAVAMLLLGFGFASIYPAALNMILSGSKKFTAGRLVGTYESMFGIGWTVGPLASGYVGYALGPDNLYLILLAAGVAVLLLTFVYRNKMQTAIAVIKHDAASQKSSAIFVKQSLKNHLGVILMSVGLINMELRKADKPDFLASDTADASRTAHLAKAHADELLGGAAGIVPAALIGEIRDVLSKIRAIDPAKSAGMGYPDYDLIKDMIAHCTDRLDRSISDDAILK